VRLTAVTPGFDALYGQPVLEVSWAAEDALPFDLCVTARCGPQCAEQEIAVARGNVVLVDHGRTLDWCTTPPERHTLPPARTGTPRCCGCEDGCCPDEPVDGPPYPPERGTVALRVDTPGVTQVAPFPRPADQARAQARVLAGIPDRARARLTAMLGDQPPTGDDLSYLRVLFGGSVPPQPAVLLNEFDHLLSVKLARLRQLVRRARAGHVLDESDAWEIGWSWGTAEQQAVDPAANGLFGPAAAARVVDPATALPAIRIIGLDGAGPWLPARDLLDAAPGDRLFVGEVDDAEVLTARFGATAPGPGSTVQVGYRAGNGTAGNVGAGAINTVVLCTTRQDSITGATNPLAAFGGTDPEPVERVRQLAPYEPTHRLRRAITAADYAELAGRVPGVQRAAASLRWLGSWYEMQVAVDALGSDVAPEPLLDAVRDALHPYRRIGHDLSVRTARLVPLDLALAVQVQAGRITARVRTAVRAALLAYLAPDNLTFGQSIRVSRLIALAAGVPGVRHVEVTRLQPLFGPGGSALADGLLALGVLEIAQLDDDPIRPENGRLVLTMAGGR
jgi:predicted phage baseplate assembly protein